MPTLVTVTIDVSTPTGRRIIRDLDKHKEVVKIQSPLPEHLVGKKTYTHEEAFRELLTNLSEYYEYDMLKNFKA